MFKEHFNLKFQKRKKDQYDTCKAFKSYPVENVRDEIKLAQENHLGDKNLVHEIKEDLKIKGQVCKTLLVAAFDLQNILLCSYGETSSFDYSWRLATHTFTDTDTVIMKTSCY